MSHAKHLVSISTNFYTKEVNLDDFLGYCLSQAKETKIYFPDSTGLVVDNQACDHLYFLDEQSMNNGGGLAALYFYHIQKGNVVDIREIIKKVAMKTVFNFHDYSVLEFFEDGHILPHISADQIGAES